MPKPPTWNNTSEFPSIDSQDITGDLNKAKKMRCEMSKHFHQDLMSCLQNGQVDWHQLNLAPLRDACLLSEQAKLILYDILTYCHCILSSDSKHQDAQVLQDRVTTALSELAAAEVPLEAFYKRAPENIIETFLSQPEVAQFSAHINFIRQEIPYQLSVGKEEALALMSKHGIQAWGRMYTQLSSGLRCQAKFAAEERQLGIADAQGLMCSSDRQIREVTYKAMDRAWRGIEEPCLHALNEISGWRLSDYKQRMDDSEENFLVYPLLNNRLQKETLDAMMTAIAASREDCQKILNLRMELLGINDPQPWDLTAPAPEARPRQIDFDDAIELIKKAFRTVHAELSDFVQIMVDNQWIDAAPSDHRRAGAYCTKFWRSRTPRVFMTYSGSMRDVITLAHELGHAYHNWVMRDLPSIQVIYPMTLAETASVFAQQLVNEQLIAEAKTGEEKLLPKWAIWSDLITFLLDIPSRFQFEKRFYQARKQGFVSAEATAKIMFDAKLSWYGLENTVDSRSWLKKLHYFISRVSFYNFPYAFGYLFALGVYARRHESDFHSRYLALLRDTGTSTVEQVAKKHLQVDLTQPDFWLQGIKTILDKTTEISQAS